MLTEEEITQIENEINRCKQHLDNVMRIADGKDGNVIFLAKYKKDDLDVILKCAKIKSIMI